MTIDKAHTVIAGTAMMLLAGGAWGAAGWPYAALLVGGLLLAGVIYARRIA